MIWWYLILVFVTGCTIEVHPIKEQKKPVKHVHRRHSTSTHSKPVSKPSSPTPTQTPEPSSTPDWTRKYDNMIPPKQELE